MYGKNAKKKYSVNSEISKKCFKGNREKDKGEGV